MLNALTLDVEDWYQAISTVDFSDWHYFEDRIIRNIDKILYILSENKIKVTFFILGYVAEKHPQLVKNIKEHGHEIACHGYSHKLVYKQAPKEFKQELEKSIKILEDIAQEKIYGYRAPHFSITEKSLWAIDILRDSGIRYDSSIFPIKNFLYGLPSAQLDIHYLKRLIEFPLSVTKLLNISVPFSGGFYFRVLPYKFIKMSIERLNEIGRPACMYFHPWEFDGRQPRLRLSPVLKTIHYINLKYTEEKFKRLLGDFKFGTVKKVLNNKLKRVL